MLTEQEQRCVDLTAQLWNAFLELPIQHEDDPNEFRAKLHSIQHMLFSRPVLRAIN